MSSAFPAETSRAGPARRDTHPRANGGSRSFDAWAKAIALAAGALGLYLYLGRLGSSPMQTGNESMYTYP
ncbi:MAG TPA: hypothetical protein VF376_05150, partial [Thermoanaerobaculia bacterium]